MIFYFSATGNSQYVAERIADATGENLVSITECIKSGRYSFELRPREMLGFVTPVYLTSLPSVVVDFLHRLDVQTTEDTYVWYVVTYGRDPGLVAKQLAQLLNEKNIVLNAAFAVRILSCYTPLFDVSDQEKVSRQVAAAEAAIDYVIARIQGRICNEEAALPSPREAKRIQRMQSGYDRMRSTRSFRVKDNCIGCGQCAELCPSEAIEIQDGRPVWIKDHCAQCFGCLHRCPQFAIQYGNCTEKHGQYVHPGIK